MNEATFRITKVRKSCVAAHEKEAKRGMRCAKVDHEEAGERRGKGDDEGGNERWCYKGGRTIEGTGRQKHGCRRGGRRQKFRS